MHLLGDAAAVTIGQTGLVNHKRNEAYWGRFFQSGELFDSAAF